MSPLFGGTDKRDDQGADLAAQAEIVRLNSLPLEQLAAEVIAVGFPARDTSDRGRVSVHDIAVTMVPGVARLSQQEIWDLDELAGEAVQFLGHAGLAQCTVVGTDRRLQWVLTRRGRATAESAQTASTTILRQ